jgi:hypothetical protein
MPKAEPGINAAHFFNQAAYFATRGGKIGWAHSGNTAPFQLTNALSLAQRVYDAADESPASDYRDSHAWVFTPKSFELLVLELNPLGHINWAICAIEPAPGVEFYVWLEQKRVAISEPPSIRCACPYSLTCYTKPRMLSPSLKG